MIPKYVFLTKGIGRSKYKLKSFEEALRKAGVAQQNLVSVSSIFPPKCKLISRERGIKLLQPGQITFSVIARCDTNENGRIITSSIGMALPTDKNKWGYISEVHEHGLSKEEASDLAEDLAATMLGTTLGIDVNADKAWSEKEQSYKASGLIIKTKNVTQIGRGQNGNWTTVIAMAVLV